MKTKIDCFPEIRCPICGQFLCEGKSMSLSAVGNKIIVIKTSLPKENDIVLPENLTAGREKQELAEVYAVGPGRRLADGSMQVPSVSVGAKIYFNPFGANSIKHEDKEYFILTEDDIQAVINQEQ
jgi:chaperonin GroES